MKASSEIAVYLFPFWSKINKNSVLKIPVSITSEWTQQGQYQSVRYKQWWRKNAEVVVLGWLYCHSIAQADILINSWPLETWYWA